MPQGEPGGKPYTVINAVSTLDGRASVGGRSTPLGGDVDRAVMRNLRCAVDAVLVGAGTLRRENLGLGVPEELVERRRSNGLADQPLQVVLKGRSQLPPERRLYQTAGDRLLVLSTTGASPELEELPVREVPPTFGASLSGWPDPGRVLELLGGEFGVRRLLLEGGPAVNRTFLAGGHVRELFMTVAPQVTGEDATSIVAGGGVLPDAARAWCLVSAHADADGGLYLRYGARPGGV